MSDELIRSLEFVVHYDLTTRDALILLHLLKTSHSAESLAKELHCTANTIRHSFSKLKKKQLIIKDYNIGHSIIYKFDKASLVL
jgi:predicted transcriptional regulator